MAVDDVYAKAMYQNALHLLDFGDRDTRNYLKIHIHKWYAKAMYQYAMSTKNKKEFIP